MSLLRFGYIIYIYTCVGSAAPQTGVGATDDPMKGPKNLRQIPPDTMARTRKIKGANRMARWSNVGSVLFFIIVSGLVLLYQAAIKAQVI